MKRFLICMAGILLAIQSFAHNPNIATFTLRDTGAGWIIEMSFAQATIDGMMDKYVGKDKLAAFSPDQYRDYVIQYVKDNFHLMVDEQVITLENGGILLGSHQSDLKFVLPEMLNPQAMEVHIPMFGYTYNHTNLFRVFRGGNSMKRFFLSEDNGFRVNIINTEQGFVAVDNPTPAVSTLQVVLFSVVLMLFIVLAIFIRRDKRTVSLFN